MKKYKRDRNKILLNLDTGPSVIAIAEDAVWAQIIVDTMNRVHVKKAHVA